jgi:hypothetical protein
VLETTVLLSLLLRPLRVKFQEVGEVVKGLRDEAYQEVGLLVKLGIDHVCTPQKRQASVCFAPGVSSRCPGSDTTRSL